MAVLAIVECHCAIFGRVYAIGNGHTNLNIRMLEVELVATKLVVPEDNLLLAYLVVVNTGARHLDSCHRAVAGILIIVEAYHGACPKNGVDNIVVCPGNVEACLTIRCYSLE